MSPTNDCIYSYILIFITENSNAKYVEIVKMLSRLKIRPSKSIASYAMAKSKTPNKI